MLQDLASLIFQLKKLLNLSHLSWIWYPCTISWANWIALCVAEFFLDTHLSKHLLASFYDHHNKTLVSQFPAPSINITKISIKKPFIFSSHLLNLISIHDIPLKHWWLQCVVAQCSFSRFSIKQLSTPIVWDLLCLGLTISYIKLAIAEVHWRVSIFSLSSSILGDQTENFFKWHINEVLISFSFFKSTKDLINIFPLG